MDTKKILASLFANKEVVQFNPIKQRLLIFNIGVIVWLELIYRLWSLKSISFDFIFSILFSFAAGGLMYIGSSLLNCKANKAISISFVSLLCILYNIQLVYFAIFKTPFSLYSLTGAGDVTQFMDIIYSSIGANILGIVLLFIPAVVQIADLISIPNARLKTPIIYCVLVFCIISHLIAIICVNLTGVSNISQRTLYYKTYAPQLSVSRLGLLTTMRLDFQRLVLGDEGMEAIDAINEEILSDYTYSNQDDGFSSDDVYPQPESSVAGTEAQEGVDIPAEAGVQEPEAPTDYPYNVMDIDFDTLIANEKNQTLLGMHKYFSSVSPTRQNSYTGLFEG